MDALAAGTPLLVGFLLGLSLAAPPGPVLAIMASRATRWGFPAGAAVGLGASAADGALGVLMGLGVVPLLARLPLLRALLTLAGAVLMAWFAWSAWKSGRKFAAEGPAEVKDARGPGLASGFAVGFGLAISSPYNFAWWLSTGTTLFRDYGWAVFVGFFAALLTWVVTFTAAMVWARSRVPRLVTWVAYASAVMLGAFSLLLLWRGGGELLSLLA